MMALTSIQRSFICLFLISLLSCQNSPTKKIQGIFVADKDSLKAFMEGKLDNTSGLATALLNKVIENAIIEFKVSGDSINGLIFLAGEASVLNSIITVRNDSMVVDINGGEAYLIPNEKALLFKNKKSEMTIQLIKTDQQDLSSKTKEAVTAQVERQRELKEFTESLGRWKKGNYVDEFGDKTGNGFVYSIVPAKHENSIVVSSDMYVKSMVQDDRMFFEIYNSSLTMKETFPDSEFGSIKIKFPNGDIKEEQVFFYKNTVSEAPRDNVALIYDHLMNNEGEVKILLDLATASKYYSDTYQFSLQKGNLTEAMSQ